MNDRDPFTDQSDPIDRTLSSMVAAIVLVGASGVGVYALRHDGGRAALSPGDAVDNGAPATTVACFTISTTVPPSVVLLPGLPTASTVSGPGIYRVEQGDTTAGVAEKFAITVDELDAANAGLPGYDAFIVGLDITIPVAQPISGATSTLPPFAGGCGPDVQWTWHCTGDLGVDEFGRQVFQSCEQVEPGITTIPGEVVPTTYPGQPIGTTTTMVYYECPPNASCVPPGLTVLPPETTTVVSVNGNTDATTTTNVVYDTTTTSLG
jgi:LysM repeat protein